LSFHSFVTYRVGSESERGTGEATDHLCGLYACSENAAKVRGMNSSCEKKHPKRIGRDSGYSRFMANPLKRFGGAISPRPFGVLLFAPFCDVDGADAAGGDEFAARVEVP
jgi:hypothetical protein